MARDAGVADHLDLADLEFGALGITLSGLHAADVIADHRGGQAFVCEHAVFDGVTQLDHVCALLHRWMTTGGFVRQAL